MMIVHDEANSGTSLDELRHGTAELVDRDLRSLQDRRSKLAILDNWSGAHQ